MGNEEIEEVSASPVSILSSFGGRLLWYLLDREEEFLETDDEFDRFLQDDNETEVEDDENLFGIDELWVVVLIIIASAMGLGFVTYYFVNTYDKSVQADDDLEFQRGIPVNKEEGAPGMLVQLDPEGAEFPGNAPDETPPWGVITKTMYVNEGSIRNSMISVSSMMSRDRFSTISGRYSGKFEAAPGKDEGLEGLVREKRHEGNEKKQKKIKRPVSMDSRMSQKPKNSQGNLQDVELRGFQSTESMKEQVHNHNEHSL